MGALIKMQLGYENSALELPCLFVDHYMTDCLPVYPLIYIFSLRKLLSGEGISLQEIGEVFRITESDVINAWRHWENVGLIQIDTNKKSGEMSITFLPVCAPERSAQKEQDTVLASSEATAKPQASVRPQYTVQELTVYRNQSKEIEHLFNCAEESLGKLLSYNDMNVIFSFHDWLRLPLDVIEFLLSYCKDHDHRNLRYIEKCAIDWADHDINDIEKALEYVQTFDKDYRTILRHMGQTTGYPTPAQRKYMDKWIGWNMPLELIIEACDRSVAQIDKPKFSYVDKILAEWHKKNITTMDGVNAADEEFSKSKENPATRQAKAKPNRFINFSQRENDYAHYEQLERAYRTQKLKV